MKGTVPTGTVPTLPTYLPIPGFQIRVRISLIYVDPAKIPIPALILRAGDESRGDAAHLQHERGGCGQDHPAAWRPPPWWRRRQYQEIIWFSVKYRYQIELKFLMVFKI